MASDEDYSNFLDKVNQGTGDSKVSTQFKSKAVGTKSLSTDVPKHLEGIEEYYISEADEPFEPVSLQWNEDDLPSEGNEVSISKRMNADDSRRYGQTSRQGRIEHQPKAVRSTRTLQEGYGCSEEGWK
jgi:hypothetical protein